MADCIGIDKVVDKVSSIWQVMSPKIDLLMMCLIETQNTRN